MALRTLFVIFLISVGVSSCTVTVPDYTSAEVEDNASPWVDVYGDTAKDFSVYISYSDGKVVAVISGYAHPDSLDFLTHVDVNIKEFSSQKVPLVICYGAFPGVTNSYIETDFYSSVADSVASACDSLQGDLVDFQISRTFAVEEKKLPDELLLVYEIRTKDGGNYAGNYRFKLYEKEVEQNIRIH